MLEAIGAGLDEDVPPKVVQGVIMGCAVLLVIVEELSTVFERVVEVTNNIYQRLAVPHDLAGAIDIMVPEGFLGCLDDTDEDIEVLSEVSEF